jgi:hypothetical protein
MSTSFQPSSHKEIPALCRCCAEFGFIYPVPSTLNSQRSVLPRDNSKAYLKHTDQQQTHVYMTWRGHWKGLDLMYVMSASTVTPLSPLNRHSHVARRRRSASDDNPAESLGLFESSRPIPPPLHSYSHSRCGSNNWDLRGWPWYLQFAGTSHCMCPSRQGEPMVSESWWILLGHLAKQSRQPPLHTNGFPLLDLYLCPSARSSGGPVTVDLGLECQLQPSGPMLTTSPNSNPLYSPQQIPQPTNLKTTPASFVHSSPGSLAQAEIFGCAESGGVYVEMSTYPDMVPTADRYSRH